MTQLRSLLERISAGAGPTLGFGSTQSTRLPGMALIARCSGDLKAALLAAGDAADAVVIAAAPGGSSSSIPDLNDHVWGAGGVLLTPKIVARWQAAGADFMVSPLSGAIVDAINIAQPGMTHGVRIPDDVDDDLWRTLAGAPVDFLVLDKSAMTTTWTFHELGEVVDAAQRTDKYLLVRVGLRPTANELVALHQSGAVAVIAEANDLGAEGLAGLKADLISLPRIQPMRRRRTQYGLESPST